MGESHQKRSALECTVCKQERAYVFITVPRVPAVCNVLWSEPEAAKSVPRIDIALAYCDNCGHVFNPHFDPVVMDYSESYENSLHFSPHFREYADGLAVELIERHALVDKDIVEVGSGKGEFLDALCRLGNNRGVGFDPSYTPERAAYGDTPNLTFVSDFYSEKYADYTADFICCRHTLEHIPDPVDFLHMLRGVIGDRRNVRLFFEVPNALFTLRDLAVWDIIYEHCSYFTPDSLAYSFRNSGFHVTDVRERYDGQFLSIEAIPASDEVSYPLRSEDMRPKSQELIAQFAQRYQRKVAEDEQILSTLEEIGQEAVIWGAGSKGITFLNLVNGSDRIQYAVDVNPHKQGKYITGTGQQIVAPEALCSIKPDVIFVMNHVYLEEIRQTIHALDIEPQLVTV